MRRRLLILIAIVFLFQVAVSQGVKEEEDEEDSDALALIVDVINFFLFVFAGGPEEVFARITFLVCVVFLLLLGTAICGLCCGASQRSIRSKPTSFDKAIGWGCRGITSYSFGSELYKNRSRWAID